MLNSIGNTVLVRCREVVRFSEGPLSEARLYSLPYLIHVYFGPDKTLLMIGCIFHVPTVLYIAYVITSVQYYNSGQLKEIITKLYELYLP